MPRDTDLTTVRTRHPLIASLAGALLVAGLAGCAIETAGRSPAPAPPATSAPTPTTTATVDPQQLERLRRLLPPLLAVMDNPRSPSEVRVGIMDDPDINAANAGGGQFYVTTGLLRQADDRRLLGVLAHEVAHDDLRHVVKAQALGTGVALGVVILDQIIPGSSSITPIAGNLITRGYSRKEEYAADRHAVELLRRAGQPKDVMVDSLVWLREVAGSSGGGFFATHPGTDDRIAALRAL
jgi:Zn-dependent protease with chaperone function